jgi:site-specific DNA-methyltransferase (adenine-specific)
MILSQSPRIELIHGDCMDYMKSLEDKAFELAIVDPPYGLGTSVVNSSGRFKRYYNNNGNWDTNTPDKNYFKHLFKTSNDQIVWGGNYFGLPPNRCFIIWDKGQPEGISFAMAEYAWCSFDKVAQIFKQRTQGQTERFHPTQKPVALYKWLIKNYAKPGDRILDTHLGSGSSAIAAWEAGHDFVGIELDEDYYNAAVKRFRQHIAQTKLF